jgi:hypothetical protein
MARQIESRHVVRSALNIIVFGPGKGEGIVVILPNGDVGVVDGCREPHDDATELGDPIREFLRDYEVFLKSSSPLRLRFACLTHPHDDHYAGLGRLLRAYQKRIDAVWYPPMVGDHYAESLVEYVKTTVRGRAVLPDDAGATGLIRVIDELSKAAQSHKSELLFLGRKNHLLTIPGSPDLRIDACAPAPNDVQTAIKFLVDALRKRQRNERRPQHIDPNFVSGALVIRWGNAGVLLGGDLLRGNGTHFGWEAVWKDIDGPVQIVKAAHHASEGAHHVDLWNTLNPELVIVTPFRKGEASYPPRPEQIAELAKSAVVTITAKPEWGRSKAHPQPLYKPAVAPPKAPSTKNKSMPVGPPTTWKDIHNAVAVSLDSNGKILQIVLAGRANVYEP